MNGYVTESSHAQCELCRDTEKLSGCQQQGVCLLFQEETYPLCARSTCTRVPQFVPSSSTRRLLCSNHRVVRNLKVTASSRSVSSTTPCASRLSSAWPRARLAKRRLHPGGRPSKCSLQHTHRSLQSRPQASWSSTRQPTPSPLSRPDARVLSARRHGNPSFPSALSFSSLCQAIPSRRS